MKFINYQSEFFTLYDTLTSFIYTFSIEFSIFSLAEALKYVKTNFLLTTRTFTWGLNTDMSTDKNLRLVMLVTG